jgi:hypothetical protein
MRWQLPGLLGTLVTTFLAIVPLLETEKEKILLAPYPPRKSESGWLIYTQRQLNDGSGIWMVPYELNCLSRRVRRLGKAMPGLVPGPIEAPPEELGTWFEAKPYTLASNLLTRVCGKGG